jgi:hypothetical protein
MLLVKFPSTITGKFAGSAGDHVPEFSGKIQALNLKAVINIFRDLRAGFSPWRNGWGQQGNGLWVKLLHGKLNQIPQFLFVEWLLQGVTNQDKHSVPDIENMASIKVRLGSGCAQDVIRKVLRDMSPLVNETAVTFAEHDA